MGKTLIMVTHDPQAAAAAPSGSCGWRRARWPSDEVTPRDLLAGAEAYACVKFLPYVRRTSSATACAALLTVAGTALLLFLFLFVASVQNGLESRCSTRATTG